MPRKLGRRLKGAAMGILLLVLVSLALMLVPPSWPTAEPPPEPGPGLERRCEVVRDHYEVAHIRATSNQALYFCWGHVHAEDRAWQLDYLRRVAYGRMAERYGAASLKQDFMLRLMGLERLAHNWERSLRERAPRQYELLRYYVWGLNRGLEGARSRSYQLREFAFQPAPWRVVDSLALGLLQSFHQTKKTFVSDLRRDHEKRTLGAQRWHALWGAAAEHQAATTIIKAGEHPLAGGSAPTPSSAPRTQPTTSAAAAPNVPWPRSLALREVPPLLASLAGPRGAARGEGSNSWVVAKQRSKTGYALLANDPHLALTTPSFWHEVHLSSGEIEVSGLALPGMPGIVAGHNRELAWGVTNGYSNAADVIRVRWTGQSPLELKSGPLKAETFRPLVRLKVGPFYLPIFWKRFQRTALGPLLPGAPQGYAHLLRWSGFHLNEPALGAFSRLIRSKTVAEADHALAGWTLPCWNFVFADRKGDIGYRQVGLVPRRDRGRYGVVDGGEASQMWQGFLLPPQMPHLLRPQRGYIATANNRPFPRSFPLFLGHAFGAPHRAARIEQALARSESHTLEDMQLLQLDVLDPRAVRLLPPMLAAFSASKGLPQAQRQALTILERWDRRATVESVGATIFTAWLEGTIATLFGQTVPALPVIAAAFNQPNTAQKLREQLPLALATIEKALGTMPSQWRWGRFHQVRFSSPLGRSGWAPPLQAAAGSESTVNVGAFEGPGPYQLAYGASYRLVVELGPRIRSFGVLAGRQRDESPKSLGKQQRLWLSGRYRQRAFYPDEVDRAARLHSTLHF